MFDDMKCNWDDVRKKFWHLILVGATAYAATNPEWTWVVPVLTAVAGVSNPPISKGKE